MKIVVYPHKTRIIKNQDVNEKEINISKCEFEFVDIDDDFTKEAYFTLNNGETYKQIIVNDECDFPSEVLEEEGQIEIGVVAYKIENDVETRYNPSPSYFDTKIGSLKEAQNSQPITPSELEQYEEALNEGLLEVQNVDIDAQKEDATTTITITNRNGETKSVNVLDGAKGDKGDKGDTGEKGEQGQNGRDGYVQYTAGDNITIENNTISASVNGKEDTSNKVTSLSSSSTNTQYPSAKCVYDLVGDIESLLGDI